MVKKLLRVGFIGFGKFSRVRLSILRGNEQVIINGFFDPYVEDMSGVTRYSRPEDLLENIDLVIISVPPALAPDYVVMALSRKKHVFCEKPAAIHYDFLKTIEPHIRDDLVLAYGFNHRQHGSIRKIGEIVASGALGDILWMRGRYGKEVDEAYKNTWRCDPSLNGGGILIDQGIHLVDLLNEFAGGFDFTSALLSNNYLNIEGVEDNAFINFASSDRKITASLHSTVTQWRYLFSLEIFLEQGSLILNGLRTNSGNYGEERLFVKSNGMGNFSSDKDEEYLFKENSSWLLEMFDVVDACIKGRPYRYAKYQDAVRVTKLIDKIYKTATWI